MTDAPPSFISHAATQAWWDVGAAGCCPTFPHDQTALKHMLLVYLANITQQPWLYGPDMQRRFKLPAAPPPSSLSVSPAGPNSPASTPASATASPSVVPAPAGGGAGSSGGNGKEPLEVLSTDHFPHKVSTWLRLHSLMAQRRSAVGWVGLHSHYPHPPGGAYSRVVLHNCLGFWWGCVPFDTPALLYHTGHWAMVSNAAVECEFCVVVGCMS